MSLNLKAGTSLSSGNRATSAGLTIFFVFVFGPLLFLVPDAVREVADNGPQALLLMLPVGRRLSLLFSTLIYAAGVSICGTVVGFLSAAFFVSRGRRWTRMTPVLLLAVLPIPPPIHALAWMAGWADVSGWLTAHGFFFPPLRGWFGAVWVQTMSLIPFSFGICLIALRNFDSLLIDAARMLGDDNRVLLKVALPMIRPALITASVFLFVMTLSDYAVPSLFSVGVYPLEIFSDFSAENSPARALLPSVPLLVITAAVVLSAQSTMRDVASETPKGALGTAFRLDLGPWGTGLTVVCLALAFCCFFVPTFALCLDVESVSNLVTTVSSAKGAIYTTLLCAGVSALIALIPSFLWAEGISRFKRMGKVLWAGALITPAIPGSLFGIGLVYAGNLPFFERLTATIVFPVLISVGRFSPWAAILLYSFRKRIDPVLFDAAEVHNPNPTKGFLKVVLPMMTPGILAAAILVGVLAAGELSGTLLVLPPGVDTLIPRIFTYLHYGATPHTASLSLVMSWGFLVFFIFLLLLLNKSRPAAEIDNDTSS